MKNFKKVIASLTSAAMVFGMVSLTPMSSVAAVTLPTINTPNGQFVLCADGEIRTNDEGNPSNMLARFGSGSGNASSNSLDSFTIDMSKKTITVKNFVATAMDFGGIPTYANWTMVFDGTSTIGSIVVEGEDCTNNYEPYENTLTIVVTPGSSLTVSGNPNNQNVAIFGDIALGENTTASKSITPVTIGEEPFTSEAILGPIVFTGASATNDSSEEESDTTDDITTGDTTDKIDDATTDDTTSDDTSDDETTTGDSTDDETTTGDSSDGETESPNVIEGKNLSWNTVDATGKSYWYENGVKQGTVDDPKAVSYDGAVRGREIYDPESMEWYWLDANSNGARAVNKEVFVPYIYQDQGNWTADDMMNNAKLSDGGLNGAGGTVYSAMINKTGKWIRYDAKGAMIKGWYTVEGADAELYPAQKGNTYYYDTKTGTMAKGDCVIDGVLYHFDGLTGALKK